MADTRKKVLIVDDESGVRDSLRLLLQSTFEVATAENGEDALKVVDEFHPDLVLLDVMMPKLDGVSTLKTLRERNPKLSVVMLTATNTVRTAVDCMKQGAVDYLSKPFEIEELTSLILRTLDQNIDGPLPGRRSVSYARNVDADFGAMVGRSAPMESVFHKVRQVGERDTTVLIVGESGTGKELVARRIHDISKRKDGPFIAINCAAIPETLIESELFGHERGSFTNAIDTRVGHFELADGGTLFLDEIGELSLPVQVKMLRFLQEQEFYRIGKSKPIRVDVRIVAATNKNLEELIKEKKFRQDLYYRINVINIPLPPLRDRYEDIPLLVDYFIEKFAPLYDDKRLKFSPDAMDVLVQYPWPGNVRELENVIESLMALCPDENVTADVLPRKLTSRSEVESFKTTIFEGSLKFDEAERIFESEMIMKALKKTNFVQTRAAELLGISRRILKYKMDKLGITEEIEKLGPEIAGHEEDTLPAESAIGDGTNDVVGDGAK